MIHSSLPRLVVRKRHSRKKKMHYTATIRSNLRRACTYFPELTYPFVDIQKGCKYIKKIN